MKKRKIGSRSVWVILIIVLVVGLAILLALQNFGQTGKSILNIFRPQQQKNQNAIASATIPMANLKQLKPNEIFDYARAGKKLIMQENITQATPGEYTYTVHIKNNDKQFILLMLPPDNYGPFIICSPDRDPCTNPYTFTSYYSDFDIIYMPIELSYAAIIQGVHYYSNPTPTILGPISKHIEIDFNNSKEISIPNNRSYFINAGVDYPPQGSIALLGVDGNYIVYWISQPDIVQLRLYAKEAINKNYSVELGLAGIKKINELSSRLLFTSVMFNYPFKNSVNIPPQFTTRQYKANRSVTSSDGSRMLAVNGLAACYYPINMSNSSDYCLSLQGRQWKIGDNVSWTSLIGYLTPFFYGNYYEEVYDIFTWDFYAHIGIPIKNATSGTLLQPPFKLGMDLFQFESIHCGPGVSIYSTDINRNKMDINGWIDGIGFFNATTPSGRQIYENTFYPYLTCGYQACDSLGPCEQGRYTFDFVTTGLFIDSNQRPCLKAEAFYDENAHGFTIISQRPGNIVNGRCVFYPYPTPVTFTQQKTI